MVGAKPRAYEIKTFEEVPGEILKLLVAKHHAPYRTAKVSRLCSSSQQRWIFKVLNVVWGFILRLLSPLLDHRGSSVLCL